MTLVLAYGRVGHAYSGRLLQRDGAEDPEETELARFEGAEFRSLLETVARALTPAHAGVVLERTDRPGLAPYHLDADTIAALRSGTDHALAELVCPARVHLALEKSP